MEVTEELQEISKLISNAKEKLRTAGPHLPEACQVSDLHNLLDGSANCLSEIVELLQSTEQN